MFGISIRKQPGCPSRAHSNQSIFAQASHTRSRPASSRKCIKRDFPPLQHHLLCCPQPSSNATPSSRATLLPKPLKTIKTICLPSPSAQSKCDGFESPILSTAKVSESKDHVASQADIRYFVVDTLLEGTKVNLPKRLLPGFSPVSLFR